MKRNLVNFTRGSQLLGHFGFMFASGLKAPFFIGVVLLVLAGWWEARTALSKHDLYLVWMHIYAGLYGFMEFDPAKPINLEMPDGNSVQLAISAVQNFPPVERAVALFWSAMGSALILASIVFLPAFVLFYWVAEYFGGKSKERKHERGAALASLAELQTEIAVHNRAERAKELKAELGANWRLAGTKALSAAGFYEPAKIADITYPWRLEQSHAMLIGTTGTGKTVALLDMISEARKRGQRTVIFDLTGAFIETFYDETRDIILNPLDARCPQWSVFDECKTAAEFHTAADALVPHDGGGEQQFWVLAARTLFVEMCLQLVRTKTPTNRALADKLMTADLSEVHKLMEGTVADPLTAPEAARMGESIRAVFNANAKALMLLPEFGPAFSVRDWIKGKCERGSLLFISARYVDMSVCSQLLTLWMDTAMNTLMSMQRTSDLRLWFMIDELGALHRLPALEKGLQTARNYGGAIITGIHAFAKLKEVYGENMAMTLSSLTRTKLILATADRETATWCSDFIGHRQIKDMEEGYSYGYNNARDAVSLTPRRQIEPLLLPDQFMNLPSLSGYIKFPDGFPAAPVSLAPRNWPRIAEAFVEREDNRGKNESGQRSQDPADETGKRADEKSSEEHPASNDDGAGKPNTGKQEEFVFKSKSEAHIPESKAEEPPIIDAISDNPNPTGPPTEQGAEPEKSPSPQPSEADQAESRGDRMMEHQEEQPDAARSGLPDAGDPSGKTRELAPGKKDAMRDILEGGISETPEKDWGEIDIDMD